MTRWPAMVNSGRSIDDAAGSEGRTVTGGWRRHGGDGEPGGNVFEGRVLADGLRARVRSSYPAAPIPPGFRSYRRVLKRSTSCLDRFELLWSVC